MERKGKKVAKQIEKHKSAIWLQIEMLLKLQQNGSISYLREVEANRSS